MDAERRRENRQISISRQASTKAGQSRAGQDRAEQAGLGGQGWAGLGMQEKSLSIMTSIGATGLSEKERKHKRLNKSGNNIATKSIAANQSHEKRHSGSTTSTMRSAKSLTGSATGISGPPLPPLSRETVQG